MSPDPDSAPAGATRVDITRFPWIRPLAVDYASHYERLAPFYAGNPLSADAWREATSTAQRRPCDRASLVALLGAQLEGRGAPAAARSAAASQANPRTVAVVTGQQAGLFGGPLYTLLKALTAIRLAADLERTHQTPAVAIFWIDAEDHDWDEVRTCAVLDQDQAYRTISLPARPEAIPVADIALDAAVIEALNELEALLPSTAFTPDLLATLRGVYEPGVSMADAFGRLLDHLLGPLGLIVFNSADPGAKPMVAPVFARELSEPGRTAALAGEAGNARVAWGVHAQVTPSPDPVALFHLDGNRRPLRLRDGRVVLEGPDGDRTVTATDATAHPEQFSPNVLLRPLVQDTIFPTVCYVGGPSELAYLGQLRGAYEHFGLAMPLVHPRAAVTLLDSASWRFLSRYDVPLEQLQSQDERALNRLLEAQLPAGVEQALEDASQSIRERVTTLAEAVRAIDPTLEGAARATLGRMEHDLRSLHNKIIQAAKRKDETLRRQFIHARVLAFPNGDPQERTLSLVFFLNRYGPALVDRLHAELPIDPTAHWILML